jgi:PAS domain S-box-containing protein
MQESNVLIVDDSRSINHFISKILNEKKINTISAFDADEAWILLEQIKFDLIILDVVLPDSNGFQLCRKIKNNDLLKDIPVIFITGLGDKDNIVHAFDLGAVDYIVKPFDKAELLARVKIHLELVHTKIHLQDEVKEHQLKALALKESEQNYRLLFDNMINGLTVNQVIYKGDQEYDFKIIAANQAFEEISGINNNEIIGFTIKEKFPELSDEQFENYLKVALTGEKQKMQYFSKAFNKYLKVSVFSPKYGHFAAVYEDITQQMKAEIELQNSEIQLRELNATKDKFFSIIAHDLRSPFTSIIGLSEMMSIENEMDIAQMREFAEMIFQSSSKTYELIDNLLSWARSQTGKIKNNPSKINLYDLINEMFSIVSEKALMKKISLTNSIEKDSIINADIDLLKTVFRNLITNAIKFSNPNGEVNISLKKSAKKSTIYIKDNGIGIEKENLEDLFRIDVNKISIGKSEEKGNGLGLIICKEFVEKMGGKIYAESEFGKGSKFIFTIPE